MTLGLRAKYLDIKTLGGAGFASQVYTFDDALKLPTMQYTGLRLQLIPLQTSKSAADHAESASESGPQKPFEYTLILKTGIPPLRSDGRRESTINYEYTFPYRSDGSKTDDLKHSIPWDKFEETYRGRPIKKGDEGYEPLDTGAGISEISFMCRSGFGKQEGSFELLIHSLETISATPTSAPSQAIRADEEKSVSKEKSQQAEAYYVPVEEQLEEDKTWMRVALDMVSRPMVFFRPVPV